jgi:hypothetical protein
MTIPRANISDSSQRDWRRYPNAEIRNPHVEILTRPAAATNQEIRNPKFEILNKFEIPKIKTAAADKTTIMGRKQLLTTSVCYCALPSSVPPFLPSSVPPFLPSSLPPPSNSSSGMAVLIQELGKTRPGDPPLADVATLAGSKTTCCFSSLDFARCTRLPRNGLTAKPGCTSLQPASGHCPA